MKKKNKKTATLALKNKVKRAQKDVETYIYGLCIMVNRFFAH